MARGEETPEVNAELRCPLEVSGPQPDLKYTVCKAEEKPEAIVSSQGDVVSVSVKHPEKQPIIFSFIIGERQARPWLQELATGMAVNSTSTLMHEDNQICTLTVTAITKAPHLTKEQLQTRADKLRKEGNDAFKVAAKFKDYMSSLLLYAKALDASRAAADPARIATVRSNLAMCHLRMNHWVNVIADCDALENPDAKGYYRRAQANIELDLMVRAVRDLRCAKNLVPNDVYVAKEATRIEKQTVDVLNKRRQNFAETYSIMLQSPIFKQPIID
ncbi:peptidyl-prolyl cis-trans isomerase D [Gracilaria domingensis]|nr:peptidyl-prolyl cis-trans isomerase D [Gracilaria domingensis]